MNIHEIFSEHRSYREVEVQPENSENVYKLKLRGITITDMLTHRHIYENLLNDFQNMNLNGNDILDNFKKNLSETALETIHKCIADEDQKLLFTVDFMKEYFDASTVNECILDIADLTLPSKKKLMKQREKTNRVTQKMNEMMTRLKIE